MKRLTLQLAVLTLLANAVAPARADTLWYNGDANGVGSFMNQNNNQADEVLYNQFNVDRGGWTITSVWSNNIFGNGPPGSTTGAWEIRTEMPTGTLVASGDALASLTLTGKSVFGLSEYQVLVSGLNVPLSPGTYWLAVYPVDTNDGTAGNDATSGANAVATPPGNGTSYFSADSGNSFNLVGSDTSAGVGGSVSSPVPVPSTFAMSAIMFSMLGLVWTFKRLKQTATAA